MPLRGSLPHGGQIITTKKTVIDYMWAIDRAVSLNTVILLGEGLDDPENKLRLFSVCARLYYLSRLVFRGKDGICKLPQERYEKELFESYLETKEEVASCISYWNEQYTEDRIEFSPEVIDRIYSSLQALKKIWCRFISCRNEQIYIPEFAYALEYVVNNRDLPMPEYKNEGACFPCNYKSFNYSEGISDYFENVMNGLF